MTSSPSLSSRTNSPEAAKACSQTGTHHPYSLWVTMANQISTLTKVSMCKHIITVKVNSENKAGKTVRQRELSSLSRGSELSQVRKSIWLRSRAISRYRQGQIIWRYGFRKRRHWINRIKGKSLRKASIMRRRYHTYRNFRVRCSLSQGPSSKSR